MNQNDTTHESPGAAPATSASDALRALGAAQVTILASLSDAIISGELTAEVLVSAADTTAIYVDALRTGAGLAATLAGAAAAQEPRA